MAIKGSLKEASLADVLQLLALGQKTGCLTVTDRMNLGYIYFDRGHIVYASIVNRRDRLGDILLKNGRITNEQLGAAIEQQANERERRLGEILIMQGAITQGDLERYIQMQIEEAVYYLFTWTRGFSPSRATFSRATRTSWSPSIRNRSCSRGRDEWTSGASSRRRSRRSRSSSRWIRITSRRRK